MCPIILPCSGHAKIPCCQSTFQTKSVFPMVWDLKHLVTLLCIIEKGKQKESVLDVWSGDLSMELAELGQIGQGQRIDTSNVLRGRPGKS